MKAYILISIDMDNAFNIYGVFSDFELAVQYRDNIFKTEQIEESERGMYRILEEDMNPVYSM